MVMRGVVVVVGMMVGTACARMMGQLPGGFRIAPGFTCQGREYGFYADVENNCRAYHVCQPVQDEFEQVVDEAHYTFLCGQDTVFDQEQLACSQLSEAFPCSEAPNIYESSNIPLRFPPTTTTTPAPEEVPTLIP
ncbi:hypothetical protein Pcinc_008981 [Petrolisthes cinctipes]|uniref:Chitin-binding type-2 domain-containing protein n=1 Tax=Petrolisthes cinctipes TaxID=88211 RepID=A0AAE1KWQ8_PETCI|nr:hypothetical protein Pcinc_008981 [Petrolisthes cinctipes]